MTHESILVQILADTTGRPRHAVQATIDDMKRAHPRCRAGLRKVVPPGEAAELLKELRKEKAGIARWLQAGRRD